MKRKLSAFVIGLVVMFACAEIAMRIAAAVRGQTNASPISSGTSSRAAYWIIVLGESTSVPFLKDAHDVSWSEKLKEKLQKHFNENGIARSVQLINLSRSGVSSTFLVDHLVEVLRHVKPNVVITMTGINDSIAIQSEKGFLLARSYVFRLLYWSYISVRCPGCYRLTNDFVDDSPVANESRTLDPFLHSFANHPISSVEDLRKLKAEYLRYKREEAPKRSRSHPDRDSELDIVFATWLYRLSEIPELQAESKVELKNAVLKMALNYFESSRQVVVKRKGSIKQNCFVLNRLKMSDLCLPVVKEGLSLGVPLTPDFFAFAIGAGADRDPELRKTIKSLGYSVVGNRHAIASTVASYQRLLELQKQYGFKWFAMQYPKGGIEGMRRLVAGEVSGQVSGQVAGHDSGRDTGRVESGVQRFVDIYNYRSVEPKTHAADVPSVLPEGVFVVSNENFNLVVTKQNEADYFLDLFALSSGANFGHTTEKGHGLIAENIFGSLVEVEDFRQVP